MNNFRESEEYVLRDLDIIDQGYSRIYKTFIHKARKRTLVQLIQALLREKLVEPTIEKQDNQSMYTLKGKENGIITFAVGNHSFLQHIEINGDVLYHVQTKTFRIDHPVDFLALLDIQGNTLILEEELESSVVNYALALTGSAVRLEEYSNISDQWTFTFLLEQKRENPSFSPLSFAEQWVIDGHTLHPGSKTRMGLSVKDILHYSPEWGGKTDVVPVAIHKDYVYMASTGDESITQLLLKEYPSIKDSKQFSSLNVEKYELIPIHPWQLEHTIERLLQKEIQQKRIVPLQDVQIETNSLLSFRSLSPKGSRSLSHLKTALDVQMTSAKRGVSPASVVNGPAISMILKEIARKDSFIFKQFVFLEEKAGAYYVPKKTNSFLMKNISALLRENPESLVNEDEIAIPAAFLISTSPITKKPILIEWIEENKKGNINQAAINYIKAYAEKLIPGLLHLMVNYGISLEAHLQNAVPVFKDCLPVKFILRDLGGIRIHEQLLKEKVGPFTINNSTNLLTSSMKDLFTMFSHAILHNHLGEMIHLVCKEWDIQERELWEPVSTIISTTLMELKQDESLTRTVRELEKHMFQPHAPLKAMVKMRLFDQYVDNQYTDVPNPLVLCERS
ncbi:IucA/IucC family protein [Bacillus weihaiensis]|uniref:Siderophore biosynthesis protein n=1 Tax=Bacillus weihaiensis TaxID=1547283 RepID=A0A1L3MRK6_9BACI|nr:IucA/IucC family protein [Bacillus weihaiensis]APH04894.1 hypothetical protein A9C19_09105 [Bacillus weihaiensis]